VTGKVNGLQKNYTIAPKDSQDPDQLCYKKRMPKTDWNVGTSRVAIIAIRTKRIAITMLLGIYRDSVANKN